MTKPPGPDVEEVDRERHQYRSTKGPGLNSRGSFTCRRDSWSAGSCRCARRTPSARARGDVVQRQRRVHDGRTEPSATSGQTCSTTDAQIAAFSSAGRARSVVAMIAPRLRSSALMSSSALVPPCMPMMTSRPSVASAVDVAGEVRRAHVVEDDVGAGAVGVLLDHLDEVLLAVVDRHLGAEADGRSSRFSGVPAVVNTRAPSWAASWIANVPMPPAPPCTSSVSSGCSPATMNTFDQTVHATSGRAAAVDQVDAVGHRHQLAGGQRDLGGVRRRPTAARRPGRRPPSRRRRRRARRRCRCTPCRGRRRRRAAAGRSPAAAAGRPG